MRLSLVMILAVLALGSCRRETSEPPSSSISQALWQPTARMSASRSLHSATLLQNGKVLIAGGTDVADLATAELYDPTAGTWAAAAPMVIKRRLHRATLLPNGKVVVIGGANTTTPLPSAELYDPATNTWSGAGSMIVGRVNHTATLLLTGKILVAGGYSVAASAELYDPAANSWTTAGMPAARLFATATLLATGKVLVVGGTVQGTTVASAELYDPATNGWTSAASLGTARQQHTAELLPNGKVLVVGGRGFAALASAELYDPVANTWTNAVPLVTARTFHASTLMPGGKVLVTGGSTPALASTEVYDPAANTWTSAGPMATPRFNHSATQLPGGKVLVAGGESGTAALPFGELYEPTVGGTACTSAAACPLGNCVDGLCCDTACAGPCDSCDLPSSPGVCTINPAGNGGSPRCSPYSCSGMSASCPTTCTTSANCAPGFQCVGGVCANFLAQGATCTAGTQCLSGHCVGGRCCDSACASPCTSCNVAGACVVNPIGSAGSPSCKPYLCNGSAQCPATCTIDLQCVFNSECRGGVCKSLGPLGAPCTTASQCDSFICSDGVCCSDFCGTSCASCNLPGRVGTCTLRDAGFQGSPNCAPYKCTGTTPGCPFGCAADSECDTDYRCVLDGGFCKLASTVGKPCTAGPECISGKCVDERCCDTACAGPCDACNLTGSMGTCLVNPVGFAGAPSCTPYLCGGLASCPTACATDLECVSTHFCSNGSCIDKKQLGEACSATGNCASGNCADAVCCNSACSGSCDLCNGTGTVGMCTLLAEGSEGTPSCDRYVCSGTSGKCFGVCTSDAQCAAPNFCSHGFCTTKAIVDPMTPKPCGCQSAGALPIPLLLLLLGIALRRPPPTG